MNRKATVPARQQGYATILTMLLFAAMALAVFSMYDVGQVTSDKIRLQNTADAAAYSTANMLARDFNFIAYTNRAMIANQAAIGQMVGLASWSSFLEQEATNLDAVASIIPVVGTILKPITTAVRQASVVVHQAVDVSALAIISANNFIIAGLSEAQRGYHIGTIGIAASTLREVVKANDPDVDVGLATAIGAGATFMGAWQKHLRREEPELSGSVSDRQFTRARFGEFSDLVRDSRDGFTTRRQNRWLDMKNLVPLVHFRIDKHGASDFEMYDAGGSGELGWDWTAMDTESLWLRYWRCSVRRGCGWRSFNEVLPIGWGAAHALHTSKTGQFYNYRECESGFCFGGPDRQRWGDGAWRNSVSANFASVMDGTNRVARSGGLKEYYDFAKDKDPKYNKQLRPGDTSIAPGLLIYLSKPADKTRTRRTIAESSGGFELSERLDVEQHGGLAKQRLAALAKAEPYFSRPATLWPKASIASWHGKSKYNGRQEHGNMFNPYWQVRLIEPTQAEWLAATAYSGASLSGL